MSEGHPCDGISDHPLPRRRERLLGALSADEVQTALCGRDERLALARLGVCAAHTLRLGLVRTRLHTPLHGLAQRWAAIERLVRVLSAAHQTRLCRVVALLALGERVLAFDGGEERARGVRHARDQVRDGERLDRTRLLDARLLQELLFVLLRLLLADDLRRVFAALEDRKVRGPPPHRERPADDPVDDVDPEETHRLVPVHLRCTDRRQHTLTIITLTIAITIIITIIIIITITNTIV